MNLLLWFELEDIPVQTREDMQLLVDAVSDAVELVQDSKMDSRFNCIISSDELVQRLNRDYRNKDSLTDVLSFPLGEDEEVSGEVYISWTKVLEQAQEFGHTWQREFCFLLVHGILHLLGYEHGTEPNVEMRSIEEKILDHIKLGR